MKLPNDHEKESLQKLYAACRGLLSAGVGTDICIQKSFEEMMYGFLGEDSWRPTHITPAAAREGIESGCRGIQRAHGILSGRLDRYERTMNILRGDEKSFDEWWIMYIENDATVLLTRKEHGSGAVFTEGDLIPIPQDLNLFGSRGFSFKFRKQREVAWLRKAMSAL